MLQADGPFTDPLLNDLSRRFAAHAAIYRGISKQNASPLYAHLSQLIATDAEVLQLLSDADRATQVSNLLFGAVHFLLLRGLSDPLADFYASLTPTPRPPHEAYPSFRAFCLTHADTIRQLISSRRVQTNEVQRCTGLLLAFTTVARQYVPHPLALVEVGASAGLNLLWDQFGYTYDPLGTVGDAHSPVQLHCTITGSQLPSLPIGVPDVATRIGLDLIPVDVCDKEATGWIRALIWPEQRDRADHFEQALALARRNPPQVVAGNAAELLPTILARLPVDSIACVYHSYTLNQCAAPIRQQIVEHCQAFGRARPLVRVSLEWYAGQAQPHLELYSYAGNNKQRLLLGYCESHGRAIEWLVQTP